MNFSAAWTFAFPYLIIFGLFYLVLIMPQRKREKKMRIMLSELKVGDKITSIGGIVGTITKIDGEQLMIESGEEKTKILVERWAIRTTESN